MHTSFTLRFEAGTEPEISGSREELAAELEYLADYIRGISAEEEDSGACVNLYDGYVKDAYITAVIEPR